MKIKLAVLTAAYTFLSIGAVSAADQPERKQSVGSAVAAEQTVPNPVSGFGSGTGMGIGGGPGSASSMAGGFGSPISGSGAGSQAFGGGFNRQQIPGSGPLSSNPASSPGGGPAMTRP